jgi:ubiquinone/menaquinone biosynthesis C-methylase UbiE
VTITQKIMNSNEKSDYRASHQASGAWYDDTLKASPDDACISDWHERILPIVLKKYFPTGVGNYLDFACGTARITSQIAPSCKHATGVDISASMLEVARKKVPNATFVEADLTKHPISIEPVDLASTFRFVGNAQDALRIDALRAINRQMRPGGLLLLNNHRNPNVPFRIVLRLTGAKMDLDLTNAKLRSILEQTGFSVVESWHFGSWIYRSSLFAKPHLWTPERLAKNEARTSAKFFERFAFDTVFIAKKVN